MSDYFKLLKQDKQYLELLSESAQGLKGRKSYVPRTFTEQIQEMKSSAKAGWAGAGLGFGYNVARGFSGKRGLGVTGIAGGALAGNLLKRAQIKKMCSDKYKDPAEQQRCFKFRNKFGRMPKNKEELEKGPRFSY